MEFEIKRYGVIIKKIDEEHKKKIKKDLTVRKIDIYQYGAPPPRFKVYRLNKKGDLIIPRYYFKSILKGDYNWRKIENKGDNIQIDFKGDLRKPQKDIVDTMIEKIKSIGGGILCVPPGTGKTVMAINMMTRLKLKTLVIIHNKDLLNQWKSRIKTFSNAKIGIIRQKTIDIENKDIVLGMLQSLSMKDYSKNVFDSFGFVVVDECHHIGAQTYSKSLFKVGTPLMLGLSATPERMDGLSKIYYWSIGPILVKKTIIRNITVQVDSVFLKSESDSYKMLYNMRGKANVSKMITSLSMDERRTKWIIGHTNLLKSEGRNVLVLTGRREHAINISYGIPGSGIIMGQMKDSDVENSLKCQVIVGTYSSVEEGFDCSRLDTLIMATPKRMIEQTVGRILRKTEYYMNPRILDIEDSISVFVNQSSFRRRFYKKQNNPNYKVNRWYYNLDKNKEINFGEIWDMKKIKKNIIYSEENCLL